MEPTPGSQGRGPGEKWHAPPTPPQAAGETLMDEPHAVDAPQGPSAEEAKQPLHKSHGRPALQPRSADDVNPELLFSTACEWLPAQPSSGAVIDLRKMNRAQLVAAAQRHNNARNIDDPAGAVLEGIRERAKVNDPERIVYPTSIGGGVRKTEFTRAWKALANASTRSRGGLADLEEQEAAQAPTVAAPKPSTEAAATAAAVRRPSLPPARKVAYGQPTPDQQRFTSALSAFLGVPVKLPLLTPGAMVLDLKRLFMEVSNLGGFQVASDTDSWPYLASSLQHDSGLWSILKQVYHFYLMPLEEIMPREREPRQARLLELMDAKAKEREGSLLAAPTFDKVTASLKAAAEALQEPPEVDGAARIPIPVAARLAVSMLRYLSRHVQSCASPLGLLFDTSAALKKSRAVHAERQREQELQKQQQREQQQPSGDESEAAADAVTSNNAAGSYTDNAAAAVPEQLDSMLDVQQADQAPDTSLASVTQQDVVRSGTAPEPEPADGRVEVFPPVAVGRMLGWDEVTSLELLLLSFRQLQAGPRALHRRAPKLKEHYLAQLGVAGRDAAAAHDEGDWEFAGPQQRPAYGITRESAPDSLSGRKRVFKGTTPKCGDCKTCNNPSLKKACLTNRELIEAGKEPVFMTKEARNLHEGKK